MSSKSSQIHYPAVKIRDVMRYAWDGSRKYAPALFLSCFGVVLAAVCNLLTPYFLRQFFDVLSLPDARATLVSQLLQILWYAFLSSCVGWVGWRISGFSLIYFEAKSMASLREQAFNYLIFHSYSFFTNNFTGSLVQRIGRYVRSFEGLIDRFVFNVLPLAVRLVGVVAVVYTIQPVLSGIILAWAIMFMTASYFYSKWRLAANIKVAEADSKTTGFLADAFANHNNIDVFARHSDERKSFREVVSEQARLTLRNWRIGNTIDGIQGVFTIGLEFVTLYLMIGYWQAGAVTVGTFFLVNVYVLGLGDNLWEFSRIIRTVYEAYADMKEMVEIMMLPHEIRDVPRAKAIKVRSGAIEFRNVKFLYNETREVLKGINVRVAPKEKVAIIGPSGAGKTTFVRLLLRFFEVSAGSIEIDGQDIHRVTLKSLRNAVSFVPQDPLLFHRTIMDNIRYGKPGATDAEVRRAARLAHCDEFINGLPQKYETFVGERGVKLSGGERQRVAIARAILKNAPILVLDEATSSLDSHSESLIQDALAVLMKNKTVIVVAHRLSTIRSMDRIIVLKDGHVLEEGTHEELTNTSGSLYRDLWALQAGGFVA